MFTYLIKLDDKGRRIDTLVADEKTAEQVKSLLSEGYISIPEDTYQKMIGNVDGKEYVRNPQTGDLEEAPAYKTTKEEQEKIEAMNTKSEISSMIQSATIALLVGNPINTIQTQYAEKTAKMSDTVALLIPDVFPVWSGDSVEYKKDFRLTYNGTLYKVLQDHTSQASWTPDAAPSLFAKVLVTGDEDTPPEWQQPDSTNAYMTGDRVTFEGHVYESLIDNNVWKPTDYPAGWKQIDTEGEE